MNVLPCKYVFQVKDNNAKVHLVALGRRKKYSIDYSETYAQISNLATVRTILAVAAHLDLELEQMDVVTAFLNGDLIEDVLISVHEGLSSDSTQNKACKLRKSLYVLKQSPRQ